jgi:hypothetical protein
MEKTTTVPQHLLIPGRKCEDAERIFLRTAGIYL